MTAPPSKNFFKIFSSDKVIFSSDADFLEAGFFQNVKRRNILCSDCGK